jgi:hypothetical protein
MDMDRLHEITTEIIRLYRQQLNFWVLGKTSNLKDAVTRDKSSGRTRLHYVI